MIYNIFNNLFKTEYVGYRFINKLISPITDETELNAITESMQNENDVIKEHFEKAHRLLADCDCPDYENSIKERKSGGEASTFEEAKFMLVSCCAFANYLKDLLAD